MKLIMKVCVLIIAIVAVAQCEDSKNNESKDDPKASERMMNFLPSLFGQKFPGHHDDDEHPMPETRCPMLFQPENTCRKAPARFKQSECETRECLFTPTVGYTIPMFFIRAIPERMRMNYAKKIYQPFPYFPFNPFGSNMGLPNFGHGPSYNPFGQQGHNPYGQQGHSPYGQQGHTPYGQQGHSPYGQQDPNLFGQFVQNLLGQQSPMQYQQRSFGGSWGNQHEQNPYESNQMPHNSFNQHSQTPNIDPYILMLGSQNSQGNSYHTNPYQQPSYGGYPETPSFGKPEEANSLLQVIFSSFRPQPSSRKGVAVLCKHAKRACMCKGDERCDCSEKKPKVCTQLYEDAEGVFPVRVWVPYEKPQEPVLKSGEHSYSESDSESNEYQTDHYNGYAPGRYEIQNMRLHYKKPYGCKCKPLQKTSAPPLFPFM